MYRYLTDDPQVRALVEALHRKFDEPNDLLTKPRYSPLREEVVAKAVKHDRRSLPHDVLEMLAWCLITTIGTPRTFRHYLPAIVEELLQCGQPDDVERFVDRLEMADFQAWPSDERRLVLDAMKLWFADQVKLKERVTDADLPELSVESVLARATLAEIVDLLDPLRGTRRWKEGATKFYAKQVDILLAAERSLIGA